MAAARLGHTVSVLTRSDNQSTIERHVQAGDSNLRFIYYDLPPGIRHRRSFLSKRLYYVLWQWGAARHIRKLFPKPPFDAIQHLTYVSARYPSFMSALGIPFCFGPVSGGERVPARLRTGFSLRSHCSELLRDLSNLLVPLDPLMRCVFAGASDLIVTPETLRLVPQRWRQRCHLGLAVGLDKDYLANAKPAEPSPGRLRLLYVGRLLDSKGVAIALRVVARLRQASAEVRLTIVGDGPTRSKLGKLCDQLALSERVRWAGWRSQDEVNAYYHDADLFLYPSLRDSGAMVVLEAMAHWLPVITLDLGGPGLLVNNNCGRAISTQGRGAEEVVGAFATALMELATNPGMRDCLARGARARAEEFQCERVVSSVYAQLKMFARKPAPIRDSAAQKRLDLECQPNSAGTSLMCP